VRATLQALVDALPKCEGHLLDGDWAECAKPATREGHTYMFCDEHARAFGRVKCHDLECAGALRSALVKLSEVAS